MTTLTRSALLLLIAAATSACGDDRISGPPGEETLFTFDNDLEGWEKGTTSSGWGTAQWQKWCGEDRDNGCIKLDGVGGGAAPNAWIYREIDIPLSANSLSFITSAHNRAGSDSDYRVRLIDASGASTTLVDWTRTSGSAPDLTWIPAEVSIAAWAGQTVTLYFEGRDNGPGSHEQRYYDDIRIY